jgi:hypothetical protein
MHPALIARAVEILKLSPQMFLRHWTPPAPSIFSVRPASLHLATASVTPIGAPNRGQYDARFSWIAAPRIRARSRSRVFRRAKPFEVKLPEVHASAQSSTAPRLPFCLAIVRQNAGTSS